MADRNFWDWEDDFFGTAIFATSQANNTGWRVADTSSAGTPTYALVDGASSGELAVDLDSGQTEIQNVCIYQGDILQYDIDKIKEVEFRVKMNQSALTATAVQFAFGLTTDRNDDIDTLGEAILFRVVGAGSTTLVVIETEDGGSENNNDVATGQTLINVYKDFLVSFSEGTDDIRFFIDGQPVATGTTFDMSNYTGSLQLFMQIQKTSDDGGDGFTIDRVRIHGVR